MSQTYCYACFSESLSCLYGAIVCDACGTQSQVRPACLPHNNHSASCMYALMQVQIEQQEFEDGPGIRAGINRRRMPGGSTTATQPTQVYKDTLADRDSEQAQIQGKALTYVKCLQIMIKVGTGVCSAWE